MRRAAVLAKDLGYADVWVSDHLVVPTDAEQILAEIDQYRAVGVTHFVCEPRQRKIDGYLRAIEALAALMSRAGVALAH